LSPELAVSADAEMTTSGELNIALMRYHLMMFEISTDLLD
jgi:hypothetical protein